MNRPAAVGILFFGLVVQACASLDDYVDTSSEAGSAQTTSSSAVPIGSTETVGGAFIINPKPVAAIGRVAAEVPAGLTFVGPWLLESTANPGSSTRKRVDPRDGMVALAVSVDPALIGGDMTSFADKAVQAVNGQRHAVIVDPATLAEIDRLPLDESIWGICHDGDSFLTSNRSDTLTVRDATGTQLDTIVVTDPDNLIGNATDDEENAAETPVTGLNDLDCVNGRIVAGVWTTNLLLVINQASGIVTQAVSLDHLQPDDSGSRSAESTAGLSAVAINVIDQTIFVTAGGWDRFHVLEYR